MKKTLLAVAALCCLGTNAMAGPNANGTLIVAQSEGTVYTSDIADYCGSSTVSACESAAVRYDDTDTIVLNVVAAFPGAGSPRLAGTTFGVDYNDAEVFISAFGPCGDFELATGGWPAPLEGTAVTWGAAQEGPLTEVYWFAAYNYYGNANTMALIAHPTQGANFADDDVPSNLDAIVGLGAFGFSTDGDLPCPPDSAPGACCFDNGNCEVLLADECEAEGGEYLGDGSPCDPNPCEAITGACCFEEECVITDRDTCAGQGGSYQGDESDCDPNPCEVVPTIDSTWGSIKNLYR